MELEATLTPLPLSRLMTLQIAATLAVAFASLFCVLAVNGHNVPTWLRQISGTPIWRSLGRMAQRHVTGQTVHASPWLFWGPVLLSIGWVNMAMLFSLPLFACIEPDTVGYLYANPIRSGGYLLAIKAVAALTGDMRWLVPIQLNAMLFGFVMLGWALRSLVRSEMAA
ncbi:MAG: hypothetical protein MI861_25365, partial [Pirellulales bacterium]|nr:hypothetical protein [Pirellulales bacterium]